jgi:hypothetical protein
MSDNDSIKLAVETPETLLKTSFDSTSALMALIGLAALNHLVEALKRLEEESAHNAATAIRLTSLNERLMACVSDLRSSSSNG